jgi:tetratricopeptide (TPR) repeat protein
MAIYLVFSCSAPTQAQDARDLCKQAFFDINQNRFSSALVLLDQAIMINPLLPDPYLLRGRIRMDHLRQLTEARADFNRAIELDPKYYDAYKARGILELNEKNYSDGIKDISKAITLDPSKPHDYGLRAVMYHELRKYTEALADLNVVLAAEPNNADLLVLRGRTYASFKRFNEALVDLNKSVSLAPGNLNTWGYRAYTLFKAKMYSQALADCQFILKKDPNYWQAYQTIGHVYGAQKKYKEAIAQYTKSLAIHPNEANTLEGRGICYEELKDYKNALNDFTAATKGVADEPIELLLRRGILNTVMNNSKAALEDFNKILKLNPKEDRAYAARATSYRNLDRWDLAIADSNSALRIAPNEPAYISARGDAWFFKKKYNEAISDYTQALKLKKAGTFFISRGRCYQEQEKDELALADFNSALELNPNDKDALRARGYLYTDMYEYDLALKDSETILKQHPQERGALELRGYTFRLMGKYKEALADYDAVFAKDPTNVDARLGRCATYLFLGEYQKAIEEANFVLQAKIPDSDPHKLSNLAIAKLDLTRALSRTGNPDKAYEVWKGIRLEDLVSSYHSYALEVGREVSHFLVAEKREKRCNIVQQDESSAGTQIPEDMRKSFANKLASNHFYFISNECPIRLTYYATFSESFSNLLAEYFGSSAQDTSKTLVLALPNSQILTEYAKKLAITKSNTVTVENLIGLFNKEKNIILVDCSKTYFPMAYCLAEKSLSSAVKAPEPWAVEGIPSLFSRTYAYFDDNEPCKLNAHFGYQIYWQLRTLKHPFSKITLTEILDMKPESVNQAKAHLLAVFLYINKKLPSYISLAKAEQKNGFNTFVEAAFQQKKEDLEAKWIEYLKSVEASEKEIEQLPTVDVSDNYQEFATFEKMYKLPIYDDDQKKLKEIAPPSGPILESKQSQQRDS